MQWMSLEVILQQTNISLLTRGNGHTEKSYLTTSRNSHGFLSEIECYCKSIYLGIRHVHVTNAHFPK